MEMKMRKVNMMAGLDAVMFKYDPPALIYSVFCERKPTQRNAGNDVIKTKWETET